MECLAFGDGEFVDGLYINEEERMELIRNCSKYKCLFTYNETYPSEIPGKIVMIHLTVLIFKSFCTIAKF